MDPVETKRNFLKDDLYNALKELFVGAITWQYGQKNDTRYLRDLGMFTSFVQARALYEFFYKETKKIDSGNKSIYGPGDSARSWHFAPNWKPQDTQKFHRRYMAEKTPAQKRVFHLVYGRSAFSGGTAEDESDHLKNKVLAFARDLKRLTEEFAAACGEQDREAAADALSRSLSAASELAREYEISNPLLSA